MKSCDNIIIVAFPDPEVFEADRLQVVEIEYFAEHVKNMHKNRDKRFGQEYQVSLCASMYIICMAFLCQFSWS